MNITIEELELIKRMLHCTRKLDSAMRLICHTTKFDDSYWSTDTSLMQKVNLELTQRYQQISNSTDDLHDKHGIKER